MKPTPIDYSTVDRILTESNIGDLGNASIREIKRLVDNLENESGQRYIRMEMGIPGLAPVQIGIEAEKEEVERILLEVKKKAEKTKRPLSDEAFREIAKGVVKARG